MGAALALATAVKGAGAVAASIAAGCALLLSDARARALSALAALVLTPALLLGELWNGPQVESLRAHPAAAGAAVVLGLAAVATLALGFRRWPWLLAPAAVFTLPFRVPLESGGQSANLLVPLYVVIAGGVVAYAWDRLAAARGGRLVAAGNGAGDAGVWRDVAPGLLEVSLTVLVALYALQSLYSSDFETALKNIAFFYVPFMLLLRLLTSAPWTTRGVRWCAGAAVGLALVFAAAGFVEYATRHLLWNQKVIASNQFESYFRVNSLFFDPNIYGRFLAMVMLGLATALLWDRRRRDVAVVTVVLAVLWVAIVFSFSQSSFAALLTGLAVLAALRWGWRPVAWAAGAVVAVGLVVVLAAPGLVHVNLLSGKSLDRASSGRFDLIKGGVSMFADRPIQGFGSGAFANEFRQREQASSREAASASHTIPLTYAAEQGIVGVAAYLAALYAAFRLLFAGLAPLRGRAPPLRLLTRAYVGAVFAALVMHTMLYAAFLEDPIAWTLLAAGIVFARGEPLGARPRASVASAARPSAASGPAPGASPPSGPGQTGSGT